MQVQLAGELKRSFTNGLGSRYVVFFQGCPHHCKGCQNPETHNYNGGFTDDTQAVIKRIKSTKLIDGVTLSGGDPFVQSEALKEIAEAVHKEGLNVWAYTGWTFDDLKSNPALKFVDVLIDGKFQENLKDSECLWRGSSNQRLIDVPKSLKTKDIVLVEETDFINII